MPTAFVLALRQLADGRVLRILLKCAGLTLLLFAALGWLAWQGVDAGLMRAGLDDARFAGAGGVRGLAGLLVVVIGGWLLWRVLALLVLQFFADEVVIAVEAKHYPAALDRARPLGLRREIALGLKSATRAIGYNLLALPVALALLVTGIGTAVVFLAVNAVLLGRELTELVWLRHVHEAGLPLPLGAGERLVLGGIVSGLLLVPFVNLLAPVFGAAMATHLVHRKGVTGHAP